MLIHVLLAVDPAPERDRVRRLLRHLEVVLATASGKADLQEHLAGGDFDLLIVSRHLLPHHPDSRIASIRALPEHTEVVVLVNQENAEERASLLGVGCLGVLNAGLEDDVLDEALRALVQRRRDEAIHRLLAERPEEQFSLNDFVSDSPAMQIFLSLARKVVHADTSLLMLGETGVGKERLARAIHAEGSRSAGPFMAINCGALPESLLESELFGHEEGAFTGATRSRKGYFELAHRGTIFLDEIGEMPIHLQVKLLRVLDERKIQRVGGEEPIGVDVRVMAATNRDLEGEVDAKRFRPDLFYRLAVVTLTLPPLRERREDIPKLVNSYLEHFSVQTGRRVTGVQAEAMSLLSRYEWPGNVRELANAMERAVLLCGDKEITVQDLPVRITASGLSELTQGWGFDTLPEELLAKPLSEARKEIVATFEARYLTSLLESTAGRIGETAARAGINERSLYEIMKRHGLHKETFKQKVGSNQNRKRADSTRRSDSDS